MRSYPLTVRPVANGRHEVLCPGLLLGGHAIAASSPERVRDEAIRLLISAAVCRVYEASAR